jgi:hypothetical protein
MSRLERPAHSQDGSKETQGSGHEASQSSLPQRLVPDGLRARGAWVLLGLFSGLGLVAYVLYSLIATARH